MSNSHTPLPWSVDKATGNILGIVEGASRPIVCTMPVWWAGQEPGRHVSQDLQEANADFIVKACNNHKELLAALQAMTSAFDADDITRTFFTGEQFYACKQALEAIAKATNPKEAQ